jgi:hypothetical protein
MPGATYTIDARRTFAMALLLSSAAKTKFGTTEQDTGNDGRPRWTAQVAVTYLAEPGQPAFSEVLAVTVVGDQDPAASITPGTPVDLADLRMGITTPQARDNGGVRGGRPYFTAGAIRPAMTAARSSDGKAA